MDSFCSELDDGQLPGLSLSLVSYGSDLDASVDDSNPNLKTTTINSLSDADTIVETELSASDETILDPLRQRFTQLSCAGLSKETKKKVEAALAECIAARTEYLETVEVSRALKSVLSSEELPQSAREAAQNLLCRQELNDYVGTGEVTGFMGLSEEHLWADHPRQLSEADQKIVRLAVECKVIQTARELKQAESSKQEVLNKLSGSASNNARITVESDHTSRMSTLRAELNNKLETYYKFLVNFDSLLETVIQMKTTKMNETCLKIIDGCEAKAELLKQQARLLNTQIESAIYTEDANIVPALQCLEKNLDLLYYEMEVELLKSNGLLAAYDRVRCPDYNNILQEYCNILKQTKSCKHVLKEFQNWH